MRGLKNSFSRVRLILLSTVVVVAWEYSRWCYDGSLEQAQKIVYGLQSRPFVYRALVPWLARPLAELGVRADVALSLVIVLSAIGAVYAFDYFFRSFKR